jgi:hypothetical protein
MIPIVVYQTHFSGADLLVDSVLFGANYSCLALVPGLSNDVEIGLKTQQHR